MLVETVKTDRTGRQIPSASSNFMYKSLRLLKFTDRLSFAAIQMFCSSLLANKSCCLISSFFFYLFVCFSIELESELDFLFHRRFFLADRADHSSKMLEIQLNNYVFQHGTFSNVSSSPSRCVPWSIRPDQLPLNDRQGEMKLSLKTSFSLVD